MVTCKWRGILCLWIEILNTKMTEQQETATSLIGHFTGSKF